MAGEDQFKTAADAYTVDRRHHRHGELLQPIEHGVDRPDALDHLRLGVELVELADVCADDEALFLARQEYEAADGLGGRAFLDEFDDLPQFFQRATAERIGALALTVEHCPSDVLLVDGDFPVLEVCQFGHRCLLNSPLPALSLGEGKGVARATPRVRGDGKLERFETG